MSTPSHHRAFAILALLLFLVSAATLLSPSASAQTIALNKLDKPASIAGNWSFQTGDDLQWAAAEFDSGAWPTVSVPSTAPKGFESYAGIAWYRVTLKLDLNDPSIANQLGALGLTLGRIMSAYEIYIGGHLVGGVGGLPPNQSMAYDQFKTYAIPRSAIDEQGRVVVALRVWRYEKLGENWEMGPYNGPFEIGNIGTLQSNAAERAVFPHLILAIIYLVIGIYHILIARRKPELKEFLWFGLLSTALAAYSFEFSQWRFALDIPYLAHKKIEFTSLYIMPFLYTEVLSRMMKVKLNLLARVFQYSFLVLAIVVLVYPNQDIHFLTLATVQKMGALWSIGAAFIIGWHALQGNQNARLILFLLIVLAGTLINDVIFNAQFSGGVALANFGFATVILLMSVALAERYTSILNTLEELVDKRTVELRESNENLQNALKTKSQFMANMSHEFRTPMHAITGMTSLVMNTDLNDKQRNYLTKLSNAAKALRGIIDNILDFTRLEAQELEKVVDEFKLSELVSNVSSLALLKAEEKGLKLEVNVDIKAPDTLEGDAHRIGQVLGLLLDNGVKFTESGTVSLVISSIALNGDVATIEFSVQDTGIGISPEHQTSLYQGFTQADNSFTRQHGGTGLGLALSRQLVELMGGELSFDSEQGKGSCFKFTLDLPIVDTELHSLS
ncbi:MAG: ATP-binding protein [Pseudomonadales bacterium]